ncbi:uncharacterized protein V6R79_023173 [Siganus canaliculatus]
MRQKTTSKISDPFVHSVTEPRSSCSLILLFQRRWKQFQDLDLAQNLDRYVVLSRVVSQKGPGPGKSCFLNQRLGPQIESPASSSPDAVSSTEAKKAKEKHTSSDISSSATERLVRTAASASTQSQPFTSLHLKKRKKHGRYVQMNERRQVHVFVIPLERRVKTNKHRHGNGGAASCCRGFWEEETVSLTSLCPFDHRMTKQLQMHRHWDCKLGPEESKKDPEKLDLTTSHLYKCTKEAQLISGV